ncbi:hypothetical protein [Enterocloster bolteae]|uniref:hypothetical protein n=1 Tax=Enterocloster bolteae TaxID=208479 RepID=UPI000E44D1BF|nr:hypothetical protein [Enterocloster bolteae]RGK71202.1 hypothetical protein DXC96_18485 [Enterocloster bolteae]
MIKLRPVLENLCINQIVSIDDDYEINYYELLRGHELSEYQSNIDLTTDENDFLYDSGCLLVEELYELQDDLVKSILDKIFNYVKENDEINKKTSPLDWLETVVREITSEELDYIKLSKSSDVENLTKKHTLWILDKDMSGEDSIFRSISMIINQFQGYVNIFAIYTHDHSLEVLNVEWVKRFEYLKQLNFDTEVARQLAYEFYVICKPTNPKIPEKAIFKQVIFNSIIGHIMKSVFNDMRIAKECVMKQFEEFSKRVTFEKLSTFRYNVENEGEHNVYKLMNNVMNLMEFQNYHEFMVKDGNYINAFKKVISNSKSKSEKQERLNTINLINEEYQWNKYQYIDTDVNFGFEDIQFGDTFEVELSDFYKRKFELDNNKVIGVIITQSCDCIIRKDKGKRKNTMIELLLFKEENLVDESVCDDMFNHGVFLFKNVDNSPKSYILNNSSVGMICLDDAILDLASLNDNGEAYLLDDTKLKREIELKKPVIWNETPKMYESLLRNSIIETDIEEQESASKIRILEARHGIKFSVDEQKFLIKRIGRLVYNNAHTILNNYINRIGRVGKETPNAICLQDVHR